MTLLSFSIAGDPPQRSCSRRQLTQLDLLKSAKRLAGSQHHCRSISRHRCLGSFGYRQAHFYDSSLGSRTDCDLTSALFHALPHAPNSHTNLCEKGSTFARSRDSCTFVLHEYGYRTCFEPNPNCGSWTLRMFAHVREALLHYSKYCNLKISWHSDGTLRQL